MASILCHFVLPILIAILFIPNPTYCAKQSKIIGMKMNVIDQCWRWNPQWRTHRTQLANCSVGYAGKMMNNIGTDLIHYEVIDPTDDPINPKPGTLRYGASVIQQKVWITFKTDMQITLAKPLLISSFTAIDGRGANVHIAHNACFMIFKATNVIIHNVRIHHCKAQGPGMVVGPNGKGWMQYAIGGSMGPSLKSQSNLFIAPQSGNKEVTWRNGNGENGKTWEFHSVGDAFENGASFTVTKGGRVPKPNYSKEQYFKVLDAKSVRFLTRSSGVL
ncbi:hypothetical protein PIB30_049517 [Stylosanthes scabra]|uniref:Pectate lyase n=1 Tax=Stylosanthes scabra TaxID=79078 RepID=A0ABU6VI65_9FABA|nr:hypothetical protein [Stylosanthes scabra]